MTKFLDRYGKDMEFCQIELNYFDYKFQNANCPPCEKVCPQTIHIPEELAKFAGKMGR